MVDESSIEELRSEAIVERLQDRALLRNVCEFSALHRARVVKHIWSTLPDEADTDSLRSAALELAANYVAALEDAVLWFFVLCEWRSGEKSLFDLLDGIQVRDAKDYQYSSETALNTLETWTIADLRREFGLPMDDQLIELGWSEPGLNSHIAALREALKRLRGAVRLRLEDEGILRTSYNKIKHGNISVAASEGSRIGISVMLSSRRGPVGSDGVKLINTGWIPCERSELAKLAISTLIIAEGLSTILNTIYMAKYDKDWQPPGWPVPMDMFSDADLSLLPAE